MPNINRIKRSSELLVAIREEGRARFGADLGFACIDGESGDGLWFHSRNYLGGEAPFGFRPEPIQPLTVERLTNHAGYFIAIIRGGAGTRLHPSVLPILQSKDLHWLAFELPADVRQSRVVDRDGARPLAISSIVERQFPIDLEMAGTKFLCWFPAKFKLTGSQSRVRLSVGCELPRLPQNRIEYVVRSRNDDAIGEVFIGVDVELSGGANDRLVVKAHSRQLEVVQLAIHPPPLPELTLHVVFDRTTLDPDCIAAALVETIATSASSDTTKLEPPEWNRQLRSRAGSAVADALAASQRRIDVQLWTFADGVHEDMQAHHFGGVAYTHPGARTAATLQQTLEQKGECGWRFGLDYVDAVDEALTAVADFILKQEPGQHAVLIIGDSPPPPEKVGDPLWNALVNGREANCRRSPRFNDALAMLRRANVPVGWAFVRLVLDEGLPAGWRKTVERARRIQDKVIAALRELELEMEVCGPEDLNTTVRDLVARMVENDQRFGHPDAVAIVRGAFHESL